MVKFKSLNFKLAVINELIDSGRYAVQVEKIEEGISKGKYRDYYEKCAKKDYYGPHPEIFEFFKNLELTEEELDEVKRVNFEGENDIYLLIAHNWDGEDDLFTVDTLEDAPLLKNLERIEDSFLLDVDDAAPLLKLKNLKFVDTNNTFGIRDMETLAALEEKGVEVDYGDTDFDEDDEEFDDDDPSDLEEDIQAADQFNLAQDLIWERDEPEKALAILEELIKGEPDDADLWLEKGNALDRIGDDGGAETAWRKCIELDPEYSEAYYNLANLYKFSGRSEEAMKNIDLAIKNGMEEAEAYHVKAQLHDILGDKKKGLALFNEALNLYLEELNIDPEDSEVLFQIACVHSMMQHEKEALNYLHMAVELDPSHGERAMEDQDFAWLKDKPEFIKITGFSKS